MFCRCPNFCGNPHGALVRSRNFNDSCIQEKTHFIFLVIFFKDCWIYKEFHKLTSSDTTWERSFCSHMKETLLICQFQYPIPSLSSDIKEEFTFCHALLWQSTICPHLLLHLRFATLYFAPWWFALSIYFRFILGSRIKLNDIAAPDCTREQNHLFSPV
jgi:hypothetical protein